MNKVIKVQAVKNQTKYDCPQYNSRGGHCMATSYQTEYSIHRFGCMYAKDISKCHYRLKKLF